MNRNVAISLVLIGALAISYKGAFAINGEGIPAMSNQETLARQISAHELMEKLAQQNTYLISQAQKWVGMNDQVRTCGYLGATLGGSWVAQRVLREKIRALSMKPESSETLALKTFLLSQGTEIGAFSLEPATAPSTEHVPTAQSGEDPYIKALHQLYSNFCSGRSDQLHSRAAFNQGASLVTSRVNGMLAQFPENR